jgi:ribonuclease VapC
VTSVVLDASALLAFVHSEPGADIVAKHIDNALLSAVNYSEVLKKTIERGGVVKPIADLIHTLSIVIVPFDAVQATKSAELYPQGKPHGMSFADRACLSLGVLHNASVITAERKMRLLTLPIKVKLIRNAH